MSFRALFSWHVALKAPLYLSKVARNHNHKLCVKKNRCHITKAVIWLNSPSQYTEHIKYSHEASAHVWNMLCSTELHEALRTPEITAAAVSFPTVTTSKLPGSSHTLTLSPFCGQFETQSLLFFFCREKSWVVVVVVFSLLSFFLFFTSSNDSWVLGKSNKVETRNPSSGSSSSFSRLFALYFACFLELPVISALTILGGDRAKNTPAERE